jgi:16S rRNA (guanine(966)-N(2))-methyltransferase RsmD
VDARVLDLFAGTGALGLEALSRGASRAVFVEKQGGALKVLHENLRTTGLAEGARVLASDALAALGRLEAEVGGSESLAGEPFDLVFLDPPYGTGLAEAVLERLGGGEGVLALGALVVVEHSNHAVPADRIGALHLRRRERYGETVVSFYGREAEGGATG